MGQELSKREDEWQRRATAAAVTAARQIALGNNVNKNTPVGRLSDIEWGWIITSALFAWIATKAEQATAEGREIEKIIRESLRDPNPWDAGAVATILPALADTPGIDWSQPLAAWSRDQMIAFLMVALDLMRDAMAARDRGGSITTRHATGVPDNILS